VWCGVAEVNAGVIGEMDGSAGNGRMILGVGTEDHKIVACTSCW
jgi:hypothetical protein